MPLSLAGQRTYRETLKIVDEDPALPVTLDDAKAYMHVDGTDDDTVISNLLYSAATEIEEYCWHTLLTKTHKLFLSNWPYKEICLRRGPVQSVTSIKYYDSTNNEQTWDASNYIVSADLDPAIITIDIGPPSTYDRPDAIVIEYEAGYGATADDVPRWARNNILRLALWWYDTPAMTDRRWPQDVYQALYKYRRFYHDAR